MATGASSASSSGGLKASRPSHRLPNEDALDAPMVIGTLGAVEMGLAALGIPHGAGGVQAAVEYLSREGRP